MTVYADVIRYRELFGSLFRRDLRAKYKGSFLGLAWSLLHPLVLIGTGSGLPRSTREFQPRGARGRA